MTVNRRPGTHLTTTTERCTSLQTLITSQKMMVCSSLLCDDSKSKTWYTPNHYHGEMYLIANPDNKSEDDGVLITVVYDGPKEQSYLLVLDAVTFEELNRSYLP